MGKSLARWLLLALILWVLIDETAGCLEGERIGLLNLKQFLNAQTYGEDDLLPSWVNDTLSNCCDWKGVTCDSTTDRVTILSLSCGPLDNVTVHFSALNWTLLSPFKNLRSLDLSYCGLDSTTLNADGTDLQKLETLDLYHNFFNKSILMALKPLSHSLKNLNIAYNELEGSLPAQELSVLKNLKTLDLSNNHLTGSLTMPVLKNLKTLDLSNNHLNGSLTMPESKSLSNLKRLETLDISYNNFSVDIIKSISQLTSLRNLTIRYQENWFSNPFPAKELSVLKNLESLDLSYNQINGTFRMQELCHLRSLRELDLGGNDMKGDLPNCLGNLTSLRFIDLSNNQFSRNIPASIFTSFTSLEYLSLSGNYFEGFFPLSCLANHSRLEILMLAMHGNNFQVQTENIFWVPTFQLKVLYMSNCSINSPKRTIPSFLFYQKSLEVINLYSNQLVGNFPSWLIHNNSQLEAMIIKNNSLIGFFELPSDHGKNISHLNKLDISENKIGGQLPQDIGHFFPHITRLYMSSNSFDGKIPSSFGEMTSLTILDLDNNNFSGEVPRELVSNCTSLCYLKLSNNNFHGQLFSKHWNLTDLWLLSLQNNYFNGTVQFPLSNSLSGLDISDNQFSGTLSNLVANLTDLYTLSLFGNKFEGDIPQKLCSIVNLEYINLSQNRLSGYIPSCFNRTNLNFIYLQENNLVGSIPEALAITLNLVTVLDLRDNKLSGNIPIWINQLGNLEVLMLAGNRFEGEIPLQLCQLKKLNILDLSRNKLTGHIPLCLKNNSFGQSGSISSDVSICILFPPEFISRDNVIGLYHDYCQNDLDLTSGMEGKETVEFTTKSRSYSYEGSILDYMSGLDLSCNQLSGHIPVELGSLVSIRALNLSRNNLSGLIPVSISGLHNVESLDLSYNKLSGEIPSQLVEMHSLAIFNVSYNNLSGFTPKEEQFGTFDESCYIGNPLLHWSLVNDKNKNTTMAPAKEESEDDDDSVINMVAFYWSFGASYVTVLVTIVVVLCINPHWRAVWFYYIGRCVDTCFYWINLKYNLY